MFPFYQRARQTNVYDEVVVRVLNQQIWPYKVHPTDADAEIKTWLNDNVGVLSRDWYVVKTWARVTYYFKDSQHALMFSLRWT
jgi:hypothetical protein